MTFFCTSQAAVIGVVRQRHKATMHIPKRHRDRQMRILRGNQNKLITTVALALLWSVAAPLPLLAFQRGPSPVKYTEAVEEVVKKVIVLPGTVETRRGGQVSSEIAGKVFKIDVRAGDVVAAGQVLAQLDDDFLRLRHQSAIAAADENLANLTAANTALKRVTNLYKNKVATEGEYDQARFQVSALEAAKARLEAEKALTAIELEKSKITAPYDGIVTDRMVEVGQWVTPGTAIVSLLATTEWEFQVALPERYYTTVQVGTKVNLTFEGLPGHVIEATVSKVIPKPIGTTRSYPVIIDIAQTQGLATGMLGSATFIEVPSKASVMVPKDALVTQGPQRFIYKLNEENKVEQIQVQTGAAYGLWVEILGNIQAGIKVVTRGNERLRPGQEVTGELLEYELPAL